MMFGSMTLESNTSINNGTWTILSQNANTGESASIEVDNIVTQTYAYCVLEVSHSINSSSNIIKKEI